MKWFTGNQCYYPHVQRFSVDFSNQVWNGCTNRAFLSLVVSCYFSVPTGAMVQCTAQEKRPLSLFAGADRTASWTISKLGNWGWAAVYQLFFHFTRYKGLDPEPSDSNVGLKKHMILCKSIFVRIPIVYTNSGNPKERHVENFGTFYLSSWGIFERKICCSERSLCSFGTVQSGWSSPSPPLRRLKLISLVLGHGFLRVISYVWRFP